MPKQRGNGSGNVTKLKGKKKKPYRVRITIGYELDALTGKQIQKTKSLGYYQTSVASQSFFY